MSCRIVNIFVLLVFVIAITSFFLFSQIPQFLSFRMYHGDDSNATSMTEIDIEVMKIFKTLDAHVPKITFSHFNYTSSPGKSKASITNPKDKSCVGDHLIVRVDTYDHLGNRKTHGGDFWLARIYSPDRRAGASGSIEDFQNGTYSVNFTLFWEGRVHVSIRLFHSSEGVSALWKARNKGYQLIRFIGTFNNLTHDVHAECGFHINTTKELCEYLDKRDGESFYCIKPVHVPCEAFTKLMSHNREYSYLSNLEKDLFHSSVVGVEIKKQFDTITVSRCNINRSFPEQKCRIGMTSPLPSGYFMQNVWMPTFCTLSVSNVTDQMDKCFTRKMIYLMGDSTLRQWIDYFGDVMKSLKFFDVHETGPHRSRMAIDIDRHLKIHWKKHGHPFVTMSTYTVKTHAYLSHEIDLVAGGAHTTIVISLGQHFRPFPITMFIRRVINICKAVQRLLLRSPETKVILKLENTRDRNLDVERFSEFHGHLHNLVMTLIFKDMNVGFIDAWDMTTAYGSNDVHPPLDVVANQINMLLTYIC